MKYKLAYRQYQDSKLKTVDLENAWEESKKLLTKTYQKSELRLKELHAESEFTFNQIVNSMTKLYTDNLNQIVYKNRLSIKSRAEV